MVLLIPYGCNEEDVVVEQPIGPKYYYVKNIDFDGKSSQSKTVLAYWEGFDTKTSKATNARTLSTPAWEFDFDNVSSGRGELINDPVDCWGVFLGADVKSYNGGKAIRYSQGTGDTFLMTTRKFNIESGDMFGWDYDHKSGNGEMFLTLYDEINNVEYPIGDTISLSQNQFGSATRTILLNVQEARLRLYYMRDTSGSNGPLYVDNFKVYSSNPNLLNTIPCVVLPVTWLDVIAKKEGLCNELTWIVADEEDVSHYEIYVSNDAIKFSLLTEISATDNNDIIKTYKILHCSDGISISE
jgi:hypothetical protein